jgi:xanthine dehydrogenase/oxidase
MAPWELLLSVRIPFTGATEFTKEFKQAPRRDDDIAIVNAGASMPAFLFMLF